MLWIYSVISSIEGDGGVIRVLTQALHHEDVVNGNEWPFSLPRRFTRRTPLYMRLWSAMQVGT
jgi:hypothetical protein